MITWTSNGIFPQGKFKDPADDGPEVDIIRRERMFADEDKRREQESGGPFGILARAYGIAEFRDEESGLPPVSSIDHFDIGGEA